MVLMKQKREMRQNAALNVDATISKNVNLSAAQIFSRFFRKDLQEKNTKALLKENLFPLNATRENVSFATFA